MYNFKLERYVSKTYNRPPSPTWIVQADFDLDFYAYPKAGEVIFHIPRISAVNSSIDRQHGTPIDLGLDWSEATLTLKNPIISKTFFDELEGASEEWPDKYYAFLKRDYYIRNDKGERWKVSLNHQWVNKYLATLPDQPGKNITGTIIAPPAPFTRSRYMSHEGSIWRTWEESGQIRLSSDSGWVTYEVVGLGQNPSVAATPDGKIYVAWERNGKIVYRVKNNLNWEDELTVNELHPQFTLSSPTYVSGANYREPFVITYGSRVWIFYIKDIGGEEEFKYAVSSQDFRFEHPVPTLGGNKKNLYVYVTEDNRLMLTWINSYGNISNVFCMFTGQIHSGFYGPANIKNQNNTKEAIIVPVDTGGLTLIHSLTGNSVEVVT